MDPSRVEVEKEMMKIVSILVLRFVFLLFSHSSCNTLFCLTVFSFLVSEGDHEKVSKKEILLGRRKDKKDKKDKGYAALDGESSQEEDLDTK